MKIVAILFVCFLSASCGAAVDREIQKHQKQQLDFEKADKDFEQSFKDM